MTSPDYAEVLALLRSGATSDAAEKLFDLRQALLDELRQLPGPTSSLDGEKILELARSCISTPGERHVLAANVFEDEQEEHDDELIESACG